MIPSLGTPEREGADPRFGGRGVTIAFIDSGFRPHPDIADRIAAYVDLTGEDAPLDGPPDAFRWHGTQAAVVCAGNGRASAGRYPGIASEARLVLLRCVTAELQVREETLARALRWVLDHHELHHIRIVNISVGVDCADDRQAHEVDRLAEEVTAAGIVVVCAAGNRGTSDHPRVIPPADARPVITVGGTVDGVTEWIDRHGVEHVELHSSEALYESSSYGEVAGGRVKPELVTLSDMIVAPMLMNSDMNRLDGRRAALLGLSDEALRQALWSEPDDIVPGWMRDFPLDEVRDRLGELLAADKFVGPHHQHVDGTSFGAAIASSIVAQMLQADPRLTPAAVKAMLIATARRLPSVSASRQGFGAIDAPAAVRLAAGERPFVAPSDFQPPHVKNGALHFHYHDPHAAEVTLMGSFDGWTRGIDYHRNGAGRWKAVLPCPRGGRHAYKLRVDGRWVADPSNARVEPDGHGSWNSVVTIG